MAPPQFGFFLSLGLSYLICHMRRLDMTISRMPFNSDLLSV